MSRVRIVTDSGIRLTSSAFAKHPRLTIVPSEVGCGSSSLTDDPNTRIDQVQRLFDECGQKVSTTGPSMDRLLSIYNELHHETDQVLSLHTSIGISNAVQNARLASQHYLGRMDIEVIDSHTTSIGLGLLAQAALQAADEGANLEELERLMRSLIPRLYMVLFLEDMAFLEHNGLVSRSQAILGNMLGVIPFLTLEEGRLIPMEKVRSRSRAIEKLIEFVCEFAEVEHLGILQPRLETNEETRTLIERLKPIYPQMSISRHDYGPSLATYIGFGGLGVVVLEAEEEL
ncbi:MAG: DegV family protein [Anaerolineales bacterium]|jgi:DegV family protein with EDD domain